MELKILLQEINSLKIEIDKLRPISPELEKRIMQKFRLDWNYHSNKIEGNQLTYGETKTFLLHGITAKGKPFKDHIDIKGHNEALLMLDDIIKEKREISENFIRELHEIILQENYFNKAQTPDGIIVTRKIEIGKYKSQPNHVLTRTGEMHYFASPEETPAKMYDLIEWYKKANKNDSIHPLLTASLFHFRFIGIHPFDDGNGRLARILMNLILIQNGYPPVIIKTERKSEYYNVLQEADGGDEDQFIQYIGQQLINSLDLFLKGATGENIDDITDIDKQIDILKATLNDDSETLWINIKIAKSIYEKIIKSLIELSLSKLGKFDELFSQRDILYKYHDKKPKENNILDIIRSDTFKKEQENFNVCQNIRDLISDLDSKFWQIEKNEDIPTNLHIIYNLYGFIKSKTKLDCAIDLLFKFNDAEYLTIYSNKAEFQRVNILYKNIELLEDDKLLIVNSISGYVLNLITNNIKTAHIQ